ncbi:hypothetical protein Tamer19_60510 [Cupriavidus sp. TA19]|uniref:hypothetical protein n=1 Tax=unclassified Cupriavidus TaxID=2640874 RepID=UPI0027294632|nr:hypothetical protein [Cupriavidus sp. TA19]GLC96642.1 hypothetical protein Tamer19_60510 [Cupriavidus sp. TA19]
MSQTQRASALPTGADHSLRTASPARLLPVLSELREEVRALSRQAHKLALAQAGREAHDSKAHDGEGAYHACLATLFERWVEDRAGRAQVVCFASAAEFGLPLHSHAERCRAAAMRDGSHAVRALYWAALHRTRSRVGMTAQMDDALAAVLPHAAAEAMQAPAAPEASRQALCRHCERLRLDARCADGHGALRALGEAHWRSVGAGVPCQTREHQCASCKTRWTQHRSAADPFTVWTISRRGRIADTAVQDVKMA